MANQRATDMYKSHGMWNTPEYRAWQSMRQRCYNKNDKSYKGYGGRGIAVCDRWKESFENFFTDMGHKPSKKHSIDRIDNDGNYNPENCRWALPKQQMRNTRYTRIVSMNGETMCVADWAKKLGINHATLQTRFNRKWSDKRALTQPVRDW